MLKSLPDRPACIYFKSGESQGFMEEWKNIKDYEDYLVSNKGIVKSLKWGKERILKQRIWGRVSYSAIN